MEAFGMIGLSFGMMGFIFALSALDRVSKLEKRLKEAGVLGEKKGCSAETETN